MADKIIKDAPKTAKPVAAKTVPVKPVVVTPASATAAPVAAKAPVAKAHAPKVAPVKVEAPKVEAPVVATAPVQPVIESADVPATAQAAIDTPVTAKIDTITETNAKPADAPAPTAPTPQKEASIMENTIKQTTEKAQTMFVEMNDRAKAAMEKTQGMFTDMNEFNKGNVEAIVESSKIAVKGIESMGQDAAEYTRKSFENMTAIVKSLSSVKSPTEFMKLQSDYVRTSFDSMVAESSKTTEAMLKLAGEIAQPISNRVAVAAEKIKISA